MFPLYDENPNLRFPIATATIIGLNILSWVFLQGSGTGTTLAESLCLFGLIPGDLLGSVATGTRLPLGEGLYCQLGTAASWHTPITSMFMHGSWMHIIGNLWFLWVFGDNVEDIMGPLRFVGFYLCCGLAAAFSQVLTDTSSIIPMVGASGAIGGVMGAYILLYPRAHIHTLIFLGIFITTIAVPAFVMLGYWFVLQLLSGVPALGNSKGGVAFWAHIGGFVSGVVLVRLFARKELIAAHRSHKRRLRSRYHW